MMEKRLERPAAAGGGDRGMAVLGTAASVGAVFSAAACCVLPQVLGVAGLGAGGLAFVVPYHLPLTLAALAMVGAAWFLYLRRRRACAKDAACSTPPPRRTTLIMLCASTVLIAVSGLWSFIEAPLMRLLGGA